MKKGFPNYKGVNLLKIKLTPTDKKIIDSFMIDVRGSAGKDRSDNIHKNMIKICDVSQTPLDKWKYETLSQFLSILNTSSKANHTTNDIKKVLKRFLKFYYEDWNKKFKGLSNGGIKQKKGVNKDKITKDKLLSYDNLNNLIKGCDRFMFKALFSLFWDTAARPSELLNLKWEDINFNTGEIKLNRYKTGNITTLPLDPDNSIIHLTNYKDNFIYPDVKQKDFIFPSPVDRDKSISIQSVHSYLKTIGKRTIDRGDLYLYLFRHTRLNELRKKLSPDIYEMFADHSLEVGMEMYSHNDTDDLKEEMGNIFKTKKLTKKENDKIKELEKGQEILKKQNKAILKLLIGDMMGENEIKSHKIPKTEKQKAELMQFYKTSFGM